MKAGVPPALNLSQARRLHPRDGCVPETAAFPRRLRCPVGDSYEDLQKKRRVSAVADSAARGAYPPRGG